ncbi:hypothetical protein CRENBAI_015474 [Crenichthys baileyi]|uniref:Tumor protein D54 n=1 Tax=Crenichthys baileyi TaxID=28760 RepID=A0AAV9RRD9_9TELE
MSRPVFNGMSSSLNLPTRITGNGSSHTNLREDDLDSLRFELTKTEDEIQTLRQVLLAKEKYAADIRRQLGMSSLSNVKQNLSKGWQEVQTSAPYLTASATLEDISNSSVYVRTRDGLSQAGQVTSAALSNVGVAITRRLAQMRALPLPSSSRLSHTISVPSMRHSSTFKSIEEIVGSVKDKVTGGQRHVFRSSSFPHRPRPQPEDDKTRSWASLSDYSSAVIHSGPDRLFVHKWAIVSLHLPPLLLQANHTWCNHHLATLKAMKCWYRIVSLVKSPKPSAVQR